VISPRTSGFRKQEGVQKKPPIAAAEEGAPQRPDKVRLFVVVCVVAAAAAAVLVVVATPLPRPEKVGLLVVLLLLLLVLFSPVAFARDNLMLVCACVVCMVHLALQVRSLLAEFLLKGEMGRQR
jgi:hypothetical protein